MALQPPSFFECAPSSSSSQGKSSTTRVSPSRDSHDQLGMHLLRKENQLLREQLQSAPLSKLQLAHDPVLPHPAPSSVPASITPSPALLTSDLLQVEAHLQSRVRILENERKELSLQVLELEKAALQQKERYHSELESLRNDSRQCVLDLQGKTDQMVLEHQTFQQEKERVVCELEKGLASARSQYAEESAVLGARNKELEEQCTVVTSDLCVERHGRQEEVSQLQSQLAEKEVEVLQVTNDLEQQINALQSELVQKSGRVSSLEAYLGGELPGGDGGVVTWREQREHLQSTITEQESENQRLQSENKLLQTRLSSISEILSLQEADIAKGLSTQLKGSLGPVRSLLSRWREKVFVLLVQRKLQEIQDHRDRLEAKNREDMLAEQYQQLEREKELLSHAMADRTAELQLQSSQTMAAEHQVHQYNQTIEHLKSSVLDERGQAAVLGTQVQSMAQAFSQYQTIFSQALSRLANYEHRLSLAASRLGSMKAFLSCHYAVVQKRVLYPTSSQPGSPAGFVETGSQTDPEEGNDCHTGDADLSSFSREQLVQEVRCLCRERAILTHQLKHSTATFEQQLATLNANCLSRLAEVEKTLSTVQGEKEQLLGRLSEVEGSCGAVEMERDSLQERLGLMEGELRDTQTTVDARIEAELLTQQQNSKEEVLEMEKLLSVARREHSKAVVQLQHLQRQLARDRDGAVQAAELRQAQAEHELECCQKKLQSLQIERNLLLTTLRQEGIVIPVKRLSPRNTFKIPHPEAEGQTTTECSSSSNSSVLEETLESSATPQTDATYTIQDEAQSLLPGNDQETNNESTELISKDHQCGDCGGGLSIRVQGDDKQSAQQDIRGVLKDLQMLSASLLEMEGAKK